jgi:Protein of unknown function (DUF3037)
MTSQPYKYFVVHYVPFVMQATRINLGVALLGSSYVGLRFLRSWSGVQKFDPEADLELLAGLEGEMRNLLSQPQEQALMELSEFSNLIQISPAQDIVTTDPDGMLERLASQYLSP